MDVASVLSPRLRFGYDDDKCNTRALLPQWQTGCGYQWHERFRSWWQNVLGVGIQHQGFHEHITPYWTHAGHHHRHHLHVWWKKQEICGRNRIGFIWNGGQPHRETADEAKRKMMKRIQCERDHFGLFWEQPRLK